MHHMRTGGGSVGGVIVVIVVTVVVLEVGSGRKTWDTSWLPILPESFYGFELCLKRLLLLGII